MKLAFFQSIRQAERGNDEECGDRDDGDHQDAVKSLEHLQLVSLFSSGQMRDRTCGEVSGAVGICHLRTIQRYDCPHQERRQGKRQREDHEQHQEKGCALQTRSIQSKGLTATLTSSSIRTVPMAYRTMTCQRHSQPPYCDVLTSKDEMQSRKQSDPVHDRAQRRRDDRETHRDDEQQEERQRVSSGVQCSHYPQCQIDLQEKTPERTNKQESRGSGAASVLVDISVVAMIGEHLHDQKDDGS
jgi:hypothetical protein